MIVRRGAHAYRDNSAVRQSPATFCGCTLSSTMRGLPAQWLHPLSIMLLTDSPAIHVILPALQLSLVTIGSMSHLPVCPAQSNWITRSQHIPGATAILHPRAEIQRQHPHGRTIGHLTR